MRVDCITNRDIFQVLTFLDTHFGPDLFPEEKLPSI